MSMPRRLRTDPSRLLALVDALPKTRVAVAGDAVLDEFVFGEIARVSREAPVLILDHRHTLLVPGGAGNTAANLAALDVGVRIVGRIGHDDQGARLRTELDARGVETRGLLADREYRTPTKTRILAGSPHTKKQQIVRLDRGRAGTPLSKPLRDRLIEHARKSRAKGHGIVLADYGYGTVDPAWVRRLGRGSGPVTLDSRFQLERYRGIDAATPNLEEVERALGVRLPDGDDRAIGAAARELRRLLGAKALVATRGSLGMTVDDGGVTPIRIPVFGSDEVADVTGAGDTVIAVFTAARTAGATWVEAAELANVAGGLVVMKVGTATISRAELAAAIRADAR